MSVGVHKYINLLGLVLPLVASCQRHSTVKFNGQNVHDTLDKTVPIVEKVLTTAISITLPNALLASRNYYQTRSVITLNVADDAVATGDTLELINDTTGQSLLKESSLAFGLADPVSEPPPSYLLDNSKGYSLTLTIYPMDPAFTGKFAYGTNKLRLLVADQEKTDTANNAITMHDFTFFAVGTTVFAEGGGQRQGGFQGRVTNLISPVVSTAQGDLTTGLIGLSNR